MDPQVHYVIAQSSQTRQAAATPAIAKYFEPFKKKVGLRWDEKYLYVESSGLPDHGMMVGITAWQQQVPLPQPFTGGNAWQIPLHPEPAKKPMSAKENFFKGAIAMAVNGVPIFNPIKTGGRVDTFLNGELDQWGGHCGKADDYHYHIAPVHLEKVVGQGNPIAVALDGYPIFGYRNADGSTPKLDWLNGEEDKDGNYHYHATKTYPYVNGGFYGNVNVRDDHVEPQARAAHLRGEARRPLRGAKVTSFDRPKPNTFHLKYQVYGETRSIDYVIAQDGSALFKYTDNNGTTESNYQPGNNGGGRRRADRRGNSSSTADKTGRSRRRGNDPANDRPQSERRRKEKKRIGDDNSNDRMPKKDRSENPEAGQRQPWVLNHASELDLNSDNIISRDEIVGAAEKVIAGYDKNSDDRLSKSELMGRAGVRSAMGGYIRMHANELDRDADGVVSKKEVLDNAARMFRKMDKDQDGEITKTELESSRRPGR